MKSKNPVTGTMLGIGLLFIFVTACSDRKEIFSEFRSFPNAEWDKQEVLRFEVPVNDLSAKYDVFLEIRSNNEYSFSNIYLFVNYQTPKGSMRSDTVQVELADVYGKWYGKGISLYTYSFPYELNVQYPDTGVYIYTLYQGMRENPLKGVSDMGLRVLEKANQ